ncbi:MAG: UvrABC system protein B [Chlamydiae bacterium]|nr:UvrABC system protein B [Chlamydiota bacterium]
MKRFQLVSDFKPQGDQPQAIEKLVKGFEHNQPQVLLGVTGSGKTFTMANVIAKLNKPTLVLAHNKTLAAQLYEEFKNFFPNNAVEYFVSYYDYYQPEAYIARTDTYIEKDLAINQRIEKMRLSATRTLMEREDVIIVSSISCIYGLGLPEHYRDMNLVLKVGDVYKRNELLLKFVDMHYQRNDLELMRKNFRVRGESVEIYPAYEEDVALRIEFFDDEIERLSYVDPLTGKVLERIDTVTLYPASHYVVPEDVRINAIDTIKQELKERAAFFEKEKRFAEKERIFQRTTYDLEMIQEMGFCKGIENYSRHFSYRKEGEAPPCLLDYFPKDFIFFIDESHQTVPQMRAMFNGDRARKIPLVDYGFRLPSAFDNRPLKFEETYQSMKKAIFVSATPAEWEMEQAKGVVVKQIIRPTGLIDPAIEVKKAKEQVDDCLGEIKKEVEKQNRILVTTLTKRLAEDLTKYLLDLDIKATYLHSDVDTLERVKIIMDLRKGVYDVLIGINLLREGLDIPEVSLVCILDADRQGFLRSETALIQTCGRASRHKEGRVIMYGDQITSAMQGCKNVTEKRRKIQLAYNKKHNIIPQSTKRSLSSELEEAFLDVDKKDKTFEKEALKESHIQPQEIEKRLKEYRKMMLKAAKELRFEEAAYFRDLIKKYENLEMSIL